MSQATNVIPDSDGTTFLSNVNAALAAIISGHKGSTAPTYKVAGTSWVDDTTATWSLKTWDGTQWVEFGTLNSTTHVFAPSGGGSSLPLTGGSMTGAINEAKGANIASATTTNIWATDGNLVHITGTTTITSFGTAPQAGASRTLIFDGALTLTNGANLILPGAANITTEAGDVAIVTSDTTTQHRIRYFRAASNISTLTPGTSGATVPLLSGANTWSGIQTFNGVALNEAKGADIASATTTDIGAATGNFVDVTGTTTITGLGTVQAGTQRKVRFTGALTLTHNATSLILPTGANITTAAGDCAEFVSLGSGNWRCVNYMRASGAALATSGGTGNLKYQVWTSSGTFTIPTGVTEVKFTVTGGGGDGEDANNGRGGGAGATAIKWLTGLTPGNTITTTVGGAGGNSTITSGTQTITTVTGGGGSNTGAGGTATNGDINIKGGSGGVGCVGQDGTYTTSSSGDGGTSYWGGGGRGGYQGNLNGEDGQAYGSGGGGSQRGAYDNPGAGKGGIIVAEWVAS